jgi:hypothetical protein
MFNHVAERGIKEGTATNGNYIQHCLQPKSDDDAPEFTHNFLSSVSINGLY